MVVIVAHIAGIPVEETLAMAVPVLGAASAALVATLRAHRRRIFNATDRADDDAGLKTRPGRRRR